jgi:LysR family transcriptional regulator, low CO2-responsive transcriptional regulator
MIGELNLNQLRAFHYAAKLGSITIASEKLFITQPAVSMQIKALESQYDVRLFIRKKKRLELTEPGKRLFSISERIFGLVGEAEQLLTHSKELSTDVLKIGSTKTLLRYILAPYIQTFQEAFPKVRIQLAEGSSEEMVRNVLEGQYDLGLVGRMPYDKRLRIIPFEQNELVLLAGPGHGLCKKDEVSVRDLEGENLILREKGSGTRRLVDKLFETTGTVSYTITESSNVDFIKELVRIGNGLTLLARMGADADVSEGSLKILPLKEGPFILDCDIITNRERQPSKVGEAFLNVLLKGRVLLEAREIDVAAKPAVDDQA